MSKADESVLYPPEEYSLLEQERLIAFRSRCADLNLTEEQQHDAELIRWLRVRNLDVDKAHKMLKLCLEWRQKNQIDGILDREEIPKEFLDKSPFANLGVDKDGYPIILVPIGRQDFRTLLETHGPEACFKYNIMNMEKLQLMFKSLSQEQGRQVRQITQILDLEGYSYRQLTSKLCMDFMIRLQTQLEPNYPELLRFCILINAPKLFYIFFNIIKPFVPKQTLEKVDIYGPHPEKWKRTIAERFPLELIPPHWGGTRQGSDEFCSKDDVWMQGPVSVSYFTHGNLTPPNEQANDTNLISATVNARDLLRLTLNVKKPNSSIAWSYCTDSNDIGFQILFENGQVLVPFSRVQSQKSLQEGTHPCSLMGIYTIIFDNTYSLVRSKTVSYNVCVIEPEEKNLNDLEENRAIITPDSEDVSLRPSRGEVIACSKAEDASTQQQQ